MFKPVLSTSITPSRAQLQSIGGSEENRSGVTAGGKTDMKSQVLDTRLNLMTALMGQQWATKWHQNNTNSMQLQPKREPCQVGQPVLDLRTNWINQHRLIYLSFLLRSRSWTACHYQFVGQRLRLRKRRYYGGRGSHQFLGILERGHFRTWGAILEGTPFLDRRVNSRVSRRPQVQVNN